MPALFFFIDRAGLLKNLKNITHIEGKDQWILFAQWRNPEFQLILCRSLFSQWTQSSSKQNLDYQAIREEKCKVRLGAEWCILVTPWLNCFDVMTSNDRNWYTRNNSYIIGLLFPRLNPKACVIFAKCSHH